VPQAACRSRLKALYSLLIPALPHRAISNRCWRRLTMSHSARSHSSCLDVPGSKLATSQVAGTRWSSYGTTVTCTAPLHCGAARNSVSTKPQAPSLSSATCSSSGTRETQSGSQPVRVSVSSKDTPSSSCPSGSSFVLDCANDRGEYGAASTSSDRL